MSQSPQGSQVYFSVGLQRTVKGLSSCLSGTFITCHNQARLFLNCRQMQSLAQLRGQKGCLCRAFQQWKLRAKHWQRLLDLMVRKSNQKILFCQLSKTFRAWMAINETEKRLKESSFALLNKRHSAALKDTFSSWKIRTMRQVGLDESSKRKLCFPDTLTALQRTRRACFCPSNSGRIVLYL